MKGTIIKRPLRKTAGIYTKSTGLEMIRCVFPYNPLYIDEIKKFQGKSFLKKEKCWIIPLSLENCFALKECQYTFTEDLRKWANKEYRRKNNPIKPEQITLKGFKKTPRQYQKEGIAMMVNFGGRALLADEMGLGKTIQMLGYVHIYSKQRPVLFITSASLKLNTAQEIKECMVNEPVQILQGRSPYELKREGIVICNYDILHYWKKYLSEFGFNIVLMDEAHKVSNPSAERTKAAKVIAKKAKKLIIATGTPADKPKRLYPLIQMIKPSLFPVEYTYMYRYCDPKNNGFGMTFEGLTNGKELHKVLKENLMIRRLKKDVEKELPEKQYHFIPIELTNRKKYDRAEDNFLMFLRGEIEIEAKRKVKQMGDEFQINQRQIRKKQRNAVKKANGFTEMEKLKQVTIEGKISGVIDWIDDFLESGNKLVVFCEHIFTVEKLAEKYKKICVEITGRVTAKQKQNAVNKFQKDKKIKLCITNKAGQEGLTLTAAYNLAHIEYPETPKDVKQRNDRIHRIGQKEMCNIYYLFAENTIEEKTAKRLDEKARMANAVFDDITHDTEDMITYLKRIN